ncbi:hypothetical protein [Azospirillum argentinense]|uniref:hypothetical protein n=1 Tax=Azospirillum argentinense TaxID=2970906 RepID=UPI001586B6D1|nr:hypothetical protein [Azospirillum argentinense]
MTDTSGGSLPDTEQLITLLTGTFSAEETNKGMDMSYISAFRPDMTFSTDGTITMGENQSPFHSRGTWTVEDAVMQFHFTESSVPGLAGTDSGNQILSVDLRTAVFRSSNGSEIVMHRVPADTASSQGDGR